MSWCAARSRPCGSSAFARPRRTRADRPTKCARAARPRWAAPFLQHPVADNFATGPRTPSLCYFYGGQFSPEIQRDMHMISDDEIASPVRLIVRRNMNRPGAGIERITGGGSRKRRAGAEDVEIGRKIRALRLQRGLSQSGLADGIGLTFQQVQKYEKGTNRVSAGRLQKIADMLNIPITFFYGGMGVHAKRRDAPSPGLRLSSDQRRGAAGQAPIRRYRRARRSTRWSCWRRRCGVRRRGSVANRVAAMCHPLSALIDASAEKSLEQIHQRRAAILLAASRSDG